ncbi:hypothetical protein K435DRAFT_969231 [Dendrothele bispora CBS 962.96]|uniref:NACHT domain-containing protein n=1 Tax=Dendrothele bispora (strain CBS 962.96) TaxID=1314807 RepID=A0A4S8LJK7_DENBC|nr:hypothetical protein K435DRAFT_969231 [Dendrothele bispora CBS 962.96]
MASDPYIMQANPIAPVPTPASLPDTCNYNYAIGPDSGYGVDMAAIGGNAPAAGVASIESVRTTADAGGNMDMHTENLNIPNNVPPPPPILTVLTTSNTVTSPFDSPEPASAVSISQAYGAICMLTTAFSIYIVTGTQGFSVLGDSPSNVGMGQSNASLSLFENLRGWKGRSMDAQNNDFRNAQITNVAGNLNIIKGDSGLSPDTKKITADMIASATPAVPIVFKGREDLVEQGVAILCQQALRFLAILGAGGMGKTSLALHIMDSDLVWNKFGERCYFIPCELFEDAESLVQGLIHVMELTIQENQSKQKLLFNHLQSAHGDLLIVFDNFETPWNHGNSRIAVKNLLEKTAKFGKVSLIVTMRGPDGPGDVPWERLGDQSGIPTLSPVPAKEAFKAFAGNKLQISDDSESQIDSLLYELEYVPLAIRLSAQHVKRVPLKTLIKMWKKDKTSILTEQTEPGRLTSVSFSIDLSIKIFRIKGRTLQFLSTLSFLPDGIPFWVEHLDQMFPGEGLSVNVSTLLESSLIYDQNEGLKILAPVRGHVHSKYPIEQVDVDQLEMFYAQFLENLPDNDMEAQPALQIHINNIEKIFKTQIINGYSKTSCICAMNTLGRFSAISSVFISLITLLLKNDQNITKADEINLKLKKGSALRWEGRFQDAKDQVMTVKDCFNEEGYISQSEANILGRCFDLLQYIYYAQAQYEKAINMSLQAQRFFKQSKNQWAQADSMSWLGEIYSSQARYKEGSELFSEAQQLFRQNGNELGVAGCLKRLGDIYRMQGRNDEAFKMLSDALKQFQTFGRQMSETRSRNSEPPRSHQSQGNR